MKTLLSACGLDCPGCECYQATLDNDQKRKEEIAVKWSAQYEAELKAEDINCNGCMSDGAHFSWCGKCPIRSCVVTRSYDNCSQCPDFPCETNEFLYNAVPSAKEAIEALRG